LPSQAEDILEFCNIEQNINDIMKKYGYKDIKHFKENYIYPLIAEGKLRMTIPDKPTSPKQKYIRVNKERE